MVIELRPLSYEDRLKELGSEVRRKRGIQNGVEEVDIR